MQFEDFRAEYSPQKVARDLCQLRFNVALKVGINRMRDVNTWLSDDGFEQAFLATKTCIQGRFRSADQPDDFVNRDVRIAFLNEQSGGLAHDLLPPRLGHTIARSILRNMTRP